MSLDRLDAGSTENAGGALSASQAFLDEAIHLLNSELINKIDKAALNGVRPGHGSTESPTRDDKDLFFVSDKRGETTITAVPRDGRLEKLQAAIVELAHQLIPDETERKDLAARVKAERDAGSFGTATKEGYKKLVDLYTKQLVPEMLSQYQNAGLALPPGVEMKIAGKDSAIVLSTDAFVRKALSGKGDLGIDTNSIADFEKLIRLSHWLSESKAPLQKLQMDRLEERLSRDLETDIKEGRVPAGWRRGELDKRSWCEAYYQAKSTYSTVKTWIELADRLERNPPHFKSEMLHKLPPGLTVSRDQFGNIKEVSFGNLMIDDLALSAEQNKRKLDLLRGWYQNLTKEIEPVKAEAMKEFKDIPGFGETPIKGWFDSNSKNFCLGTKPEKGQWQPLDLIKLDMKLKETRDAAGQLTSVEVTPHCEFKTIPVLGYLNSFGTIIHESTGKTVKYKPDAPVLVQTGPGQAEIVLARDLNGWLLRQQARLLADEVITVGMDGAMVVTGTVGLRAAYTAGSLAAKGILKAEAAEITSALLRNKLSSGFQIVLGATGVLNNAGAENYHPLIPAAMTARSAYFLGHASLDIANFFKLPQTSKAFVDMISPKTGAAMDRTITSLRGTEAVSKTSINARELALKELGLPTQAADFLARQTFAVTEKGFVIMTALEIATLKAKGCVSTDDQNEFERIKPNELNKFAGLFGRLQDGRHLTADLQSFAAITCGAAERPAADEMISKTVKLLQTGASDSDKAQLRQQLMDYLRYRPEQINSIQDGRQDPFSQDQLETMARKGDKLSPQLRKVATLCTLLLAERSENGHLKELVAEREITVGPYLRAVKPESSPAMDGIQQTQYEKVPAHTVKQSVGAAELVEMLEADLWSSADRVQRIAKGKALVDAGVLPPGTMADMLLTALSNPAKDATERQGIEHLIELLSITSKLQITEKLMSNSAGYAGINAGLTSKDITNKLALAAEKMPDSKLKASILAALPLLKEGVAIDDVAKKRFASMFLAEEPGISMQSFRDQVNLDLKARLKKADTNGADSKELTADWERKLRAVEHLLDDGIKTGNFPDALTNALYECMDSNIPAIQVSAWQAFVQQRKEGKNLLDLLVQSQPEKNWRLTLAQKTDDIFASLEMRPNIQKSAWIERGLAQVKLCEMAAPFYRDLVRQAQDKPPAQRKEWLEAADLFCSRLYLSMEYSKASSGTRPQNPEEVRIAAANALAALKFSNSDMLAQLSEHISPDDEPCSAVRLAAIKAISQMQIPSKQISDLMGPLAKKETDPAVVELLAKFHQPDGTIHDHDSARSKQERANLEEQQRRTTYDDTAVKAFLKTQFPRLIQDGKSSILGYLDPNEVLVEPVANWFGAWKSKPTLQQMWQRCLQDKDYNSSLVDWELVAQNEALKAYMNGLDGIRLLIERGDKITKNIPAGQGDAKLSQSEAAMCALFSLLRSPSQMGPAFYSHRKGLEQGIYTPDQEYIAIEGRVAARRKEICQSSSLRDLREDPWPEAQQKMAENVLQLCKSGPPDLNLNLLVNNIFDTVIPKSHALTTPNDDKVGITLVKSLEAIISRPDCSAETQRLIVTRLSEFVRTGSAVTSREATMVALLDLVDRYLSTLDPQSASFAELRNGIAVRSFSEAAPASVRLRATEIHERNWNSVLQLYYCQPATQKTDRERFESLPQADKLRAKTQTANLSNDLEVRFACERIIAAAQGGALNNQQWSSKFTATLVDLAKSKDIDDRVRLAACIALKQTRSVPESEIKPLLLQLSLNSQRIAVRHDAQLVLNGVKGKGITEDELELPKSNLIKSLSKATGLEESELSRRSRRSLIDYAAWTLLREDLDKDTARELRTCLHRYGQAASVMVNQIDKSNDEGWSQTKECIEDSLRALGLPASDIQWLSGCSSNYSYELSQIQSTTEFKQMVDRLSKQHAQTGQIPSLLIALNQFVNLSAHEMEQKLKANDKVAPETFNAAVTAIALQERLVAIYYPTGTDGRFNGMRNAAVAMERLSQLHIADPKRGSREQPVKLTLDLYDRTLEAISDIKKRQPNNRFAESNVQQIIESQVKHALLTCHYMNTHGRKPDNFLLQQFLSKADKSLKEHPRQDSPSFHYLSALKHLVELPVVPADSKAPTLENLERSLKKMVELTAAQHSKESSAYQQSLSVMNDFLKRAKESRK
jgi:hypothetical protein